MMAMEIKRRRLKNMKIDEVSFVDRPANLRPFLFMKSLTPILVAKAEGDSEGLKVEFDSDGTVGGTTISVNGKALENPMSFSMGFYPCPDGGTVGPPDAQTEPADDDEVSLSCMYTLRGPEDGGFRQSQNFSLMKNMQLVDDEIEKAAEPKPCPTCKGTGKVDGKDCPDCNGTGKVQPKGKFPFKKAADEDLAALQGLAPVDPAVDADLAKALAPHAATVALYRADLPAELDEAIKSLLTLACQTEEATLEKDMPTESVKPVEPPAPTVTPAPAAVAPAGMSDADVNRIATAVAEMLSKKDPPAPAAPAAPADPPVADDAEQELDPAALGAELAQATVEAINEKES